MDMNRRGFFGALFGGAAAFALDPEKLLWRPGAKLISIPAASFPFDDERFASAYVQIVLRVLNKYTPFASYVGKIGMGDYVPTSFVVPQGLRTANEHLTALWPFAGGNERNPNTPKGHPPPFMPEVN